MNKTQKIHSLVRDLQLSLKSLIILRDKGNLNWTVTAPGLWASGQVPAAHSSSYSITKTMVADIVEQMRAPGTAKGKEPVFTYDGPVYIRPIGRGCVLSPDRQGGEFLDDVLSRLFTDGGYDMGIMFWAYPPEKDDYSEEPE